MKLIRLLAVIIAMCTPGLAHAFSWTLGEVDSVGTIEFRSSA